MKVVNLKLLYPDIYVNDLYILVEDKIYKILNRKTTEKITFISFSEQDFDIVPFAYSENYDFEFLEELLISKLNELPSKQMNRIYEAYYLNLSKSEIARIEGCTEGAVRKSINRGLRQLERKIKKLI